MISISSNSEFHMSQDSGGLDHSQCYSETWEYQEEKRAVLAFYLQVSVVHTQVVPTKGICA